MMGTKERAFVPLPHDVSLESLVLSTYFYCRLEEAIDLSFVRELVRPLYAGARGHMTIFHLIVTDGEKHSQLT